MTVHHFHRSTFLTTSPIRVHLLPQAKSLLIARRGYGDAEAFEELLDVAHRHHVSVARAARSLIELASRTENSGHAHPGDFAEWSALLARPLLAGGV